jgi:hypothetical protein
MAQGSHKKASEQFVMCVENGTNPASLQLLKVYRTLPDTEAQRHKMIRVIDEEGEDYLYPNDYFAKVELSSAARKRFAEASERTDVAAQR